MEIFYDYGTDFNLSERKDLCYFSVNNLCTNVKYCLTMGTLTSQSVNSAIKQNSDALLPTSPIKWVVKSQVVSLLQAGQRMVAFRCQYRLHIVFPPLSSPRGHYSKPGLVHKRKGIKQLAFLVAVQGSESG